MIVDELWWCNVFEWWYFDFIDEVVDVFFIVVFGWKNLVFGCKILFIFVEF